ncbi:MAG: hypothetical protein E7374_01190 [Clostridiales bacterium]|nr:hypothetical protein [Clostridiales bacterium]
MGSYITFGIVCDKKIGKERFLNNIFNIIVNNKEYITNLYFKYPLDENCEYWQESQESILNLRNILEKCFELDLAELKFDYIKEDKIYSDILLSIKHVENDSYGLLCSIPERYFEYSKGINNIELKIEEALINLMKYGFDYIFCDNESDISYPIKRVYKENLYSILITKKDKEIRHANWKIDGLSLRN